MFELQLATILSFIISLFVLYRLLIKKYDEHVGLLKDELEYKHNYKSKLEEIKLFYEEEKKILLNKVKFAEDEKTEVEIELNNVSQRIDEIQIELSKESSEKSNIQQISTRQQRYLLNKLNKAEKECNALARSNIELQNQYRELVQFIKDKHGQDALLNFHYGEDPVELIKHRRRYAIQQRYKSKDL